MGDVFGCCVDVVGLVGGLEVTYVTRGSWEVSSEVEWGLCEGLEVTYVTRDVVEVTLGTWVTCWIVLEEKWVVGGV